ncbi:CXXC motif containing zinc binding protein isoform X3 [Lynx canadensis]|uniref:CXXC motif containing zinc binding protein isoform X3 n=1 Tax=Lynx canadensis TaxID=61383 RepID=UPI0011B0E09F|nr:CXXC motif containing zinc binding protein isoform X3 [Lynx canadensis]
MGVRAVEAISVLYISLEFPARLGASRRGACQHEKHLTCSLPGEKFSYILGGAGCKDEMKCGNCGEISEKWQYIRLMAEDNERFKTIVEFECRGLEPVDFQPQAGFAAEGVESGTVFSDINLQEKDWTDYDEKAQESVGIYEVTHQFVKC